MGEIVERTVVGYMSDNGENFVAIQLIKDWCADKESVFLSPYFSKMAVSNVGHHTHFNIIQLIFIETKSDAN